MKDVISMKFRLCFGCFSKGHIQSQCRRVRICRTNVPKAKIIPGRETRPISNFAPQSSTEPQSCNSEYIPITSALVSNESFVSMCIVPVVLVHPNFSTAVEIFAFLDAYSQGTFIDESLLESFLIV